MRQLRRSLTTRGAAFAGCGLVLVASGILLGQPDVTAEQFRDEMAEAVGARLIVHTNEEAIGEGTQPFKVGTQRCCGLLKTKALLDGLSAGNFDAAIGGARRDEEKSRAKERVFSIRNDKGQWDPKRQRPELWNLLNGCNLV